MTRTRAALLVLALLAGLALAPPAAAQSKPSGTIRLASQTSWLGPTGNFELHLRLDELSEADRLDVVVTLHGHTSSRSAFAQSLEGRPQSTARRFPATAVGLLPTDPQGDKVIELTQPVAGLPATPFTLPPNLRQGVYPVTVALRVHGGTTVDSFVTHLVRLPDDTELTPLAVAWIQPVGATPALRADGTSAIDGDERTSLQQVIQSVADHAQLPLTLDVTPETAGALAPADLATLRGSLAGDQVLATPYVDVDPGALAAAGVADDLVAQRQLGEDTLDATLGDRGDDRTWSSTRPLSTEALARLRALGVTRVVLPETSLEPLDPDVTRSRTLTRPFSLAAGGGLLVEAASVDPGLLDHFRGRGDQVLAAHQLLADLAVLFFDSPGSSRGVAVRPPDGWRPNRAFLDVVLDALGSTSILHPVTLDDLFEQVAPLEDDDVGVVRTVAPEGRTSTLPARRLADAHRALDQLTSLLGPAAEAVPPVRARLLVSEASRLPAARREALLTSVEAARDDVRDRLHLPDRRTFRLTAREGTLPLTVVNGNDVVVHVQLVLSSDKLEFTQVHDGDRSRQVVGDLELRPGTRTLNIPVQARASGSFNLRVTLLTPDGAELRRSRLTVRSTVFSGVGIVLSIGAGLFLLLWWAKHWRTSRRAQDLVEAPS